jgi:hypothetical protein
LGKKNTKRGLAWDNSSIDPHITTHKHLNYSRWLHSFQAKHTSEIQTNTFSDTRKTKSNRCLAISTGSRIQFIRYHLGAVFTTYEDRSISTMACRWGSLRNPTLRSRKRPASCLYQAMGFTPQSRTWCDGNPVMRLITCPSRRPDLGGSRIAGGNLDRFITVNYNI